MHISHRTQDAPAEVAREVSVTQLQGLVLAFEILIATSAVRQLIREGRLDAINDALQSGMQQGMISKDACIKNLFQKKIITQSVALEHMRTPEILGG